MIDDREALVKKLAALCTEASGAIEGDAGDSLLAVIPEAWDSLADYLVQRGFILIREALEPQEDG